MAQDQAKVSGSKLSDKQALTYVRERVDSSGTNPERRSLERSWVDAMAYYQGVQDYQRTGTGALKQYKRGTGRVRYQHNIIRPQILRNVARMTQLNTVGEVLPSSTDIGDILAADVGSRYLKWRRQSREYQRAMLKLNLWKCVCGLAFTKSWWDPTAGDAVRIYLDKKFAVLPGGKRAGKPRPKVNVSDKERRDMDAAGQFEDIAPGAPRVEVASPFEIVWDWRARDGGLDDAAWVTHRKLMHREQARKLFPDMRRVIDKASAWDHSQGAQHFLELVAQMNAGSESLSQPIETDYERGDLVLVEEFWEVPLPDNKNKGRLVTLIGDKVAQNGPNPLASAGITHPFVEHVWFPNPGQLAGTGLATETMQAQHAYNRISSQIMEQIVLHSNPRVYAARNSGIKEIDLSPRPNNLVLYNGSAPKPMTEAPPPMAPHLLAERDKRLQEAEYTAAVSTLDQGGSPGQLRGSIGVRLLIDKNEQIMDPVVQAEALSIQALSEREVRLAGTFMKGRQLLQILGESGKRDAFYFTGADLRGNYNVVVTTEPGQRDNSLSRVADLDFLLERGVLNPQDPADKAMVLKHLHFQTDRDLFGQELDEETNERVTLDRIMMGQGMGESPPVNQWDLPEARLRAINSVRRSMDLWNGLSEEVQRVISERAAAYEGIIAQAQQQQLAMMQAMQGGAKPAGNPSPPKRSEEVA